MTREEILALTDSDLLAYYDTSVAALQSFNEEWEEVQRLHQAWYYTRFQLHPLTIFGGTLAAGGFLLLIIASIRYGLDDVIMALSGGIVALGMIIVPISLRFKKSSDEEHMAYRTAKAAFEKLSSDPPEPLASAVIFFGPDDVEKIWELRDIVNNGLADSHPDALREYQRRHEIKDWNELYKKTHEKDLLDKAKQISSIISPFKSSRVRNTV